MTERTIKRRSAFWLCAAVCIGIGMVSGCMSTHIGSSSLAYVVVEGKSIADVREVTSKVFSSELYKVQHSGERGTVFVREASRRDRLRYARYGQGLHMRVDVTFEEYPPSAILVRADAYAVPAGSAGATTKILHIAGGEYRTLLKRVKAELGQ